VDRLYLVRSGEAIDVARQFEVGSHSMSGHEDDTCKMLSVVFAVAPFTPLLVNAAAFEARFTRPINESLAQQVLHVITEHDCQGMDYYASRLPDMSDEEIISSLVTEQKLHLWWD
jgi:hypothetical protein